MSQTIMSYITNYPIITAVVMLLVTHLICRWCFHDAYFSLKTGSVIMAWTMFFWICLPVYGVASSVMILPAIGMLVVWCYVLLMYANGALLDDVVHDARFTIFDMGYWASGTALMVVLLDEAEQSLHGLIVFLSIVSVIVYLYYVFLIFRWFYRAHHQKFHVHADGVLFLFTISTLSILLLLQEVTYTRLPPLVVHLIFVFSIVTYVLTFMMILYHRWFAHKRHLMLVWSGASVLDYGALALMGVCLAQSSLYSVWVVQWLWWVTIVILLLTEIVLLSNAFIAMRHKGSLQVIGHRGDTPWLRIFSLSIFYGFSLAYYNLIMESGWLAAVVVEYGHYFITVLFVMQLVSILINLLRRNIR